MNDDSPGADGPGEEFDHQLTHVPQTQGRQALIREITIRLAFELAHGQGDAGKD